MKIKKWPNKVRRFFSLNKKQLRKKDQDVENVAGTNSTSKTIKLPWSPEDIFDELNGEPVPDEIRGAVLLVEVGGEEKGWVLDFSGKEKASENGDTIVIARYDLPESRVKSKKALSAPPQQTYIHKNGDTLELRSLPWIWYKDRKTFSKIESGKLSDMVAFVTGKISVSGDPSKWDGIEPSWNDAKERVTVRRKALNVAGGGGEEDGELEAEAEDEEEDDIDEEARIIATFKPDVEPRDPRKREFWKRHFGTDFLVTSYLFLLSSLAYNFFTINKFLSSATSATDVANFVSGIFYSVGAIYFIKLSYPETTMLMAYRVMAIDPSTMTWIQRYFTANEMLIALWIFTLAFAVPYSVVVIYEFTKTLNYQKLVVGSLQVIVGTLLISVLNVSAMPDAMRANNGRGSSFFLDMFWAPLLRLKNDEARFAFWVKHVGNDGLAGAWIFAILGIIGGIVVMPIVILHPLSPMAWSLFWSTIPFSIGSVLLVRASYPENMNTSILFSDSNDLDDKEEAATVAVSFQSNGEHTPLLV